MIKNLNTLKLMVAIAVLFATVSCGSDKPKKIRIGFAMDTYTEERWKKDAEFFKQKIEALGGEVEVQACNGNEQVQNQQIENFITKQVDLILIVPHNSKTCATAVKQANEANIPIIAYDRMIKDCDISMYISFDNEKVGEMQATYATQVAPKGNYLLAGGSATDENAILYRKGQMNILQPFVDKGEIKILIDQFCKDWLPVEALKLTQNALTLSNNTIAAIVVANDGLAGGCIQALTEQQLQGKVPVTGQDAEISAIQRILDGTQSMTVYKPVKILAETAAEVAMGLVKKASTIAETKKMNNGVKDVPSILLTPVMVTKENIEATVIKDGYIDKSKLKFQ
nr:substrate-binding domain-containing protein [Bacteroidota bacterium]